VNLYRVTAHLEIEINQSTPEGAAREARKRLIEELHDAELTVVFDDGGCWVEIGKFSPEERRS
jgi:hypothetical protein